MLFGKLGVDFFTTSELLYPNMKVGIRLNIARPKFYMFSDNPNVSLRIVDCSLYNPYYTQRRSSQEANGYASIQSSTI